MATVAKFHALHNAKNYTFFVLIIWFIYRLVFGVLSEDFEELVVKPLLFLGPVFYFLAVENASLKSLGFHFKNLFSSLYFIFALGAGFALLGLIINIIKYSGANFTTNLGEFGFLTAFLLSIITAATEETAFRGYLFSRLLKGFDNELKANLISSIIWTAVHIPIVVSMGLQNTFGLVLYLGLIFLFGFGSAFVFARTKNIAASILLHLLWEWPILLFR